MATHKSALKADRTSIQRRDRNRAYRTRLRSGIKELRQAVASGETGAAEKLLPGTISLIDRSVQKGVLHDRAAARHKSRLSRLVQSAGSKTTN